MSADGMPEDLPDRAALAPGMRVDASVDGRDARADGFRVAIVEPPLDDRPNDSTGSDRSPLVSRGPCETPQTQAWDAPLARPGSP